MQPGKAMTRCTCKASWASVLLFPLFTRAQKHVLYCSVGQALLAALHPYPAVDDRGYMAQTWIWHMLIALPTTGELQKG